MNLLVKKIIRIKRISKFLIGPVLQLHTVIYKLAGMIAVQLNEGIHPKHRIMQYKEWFLHNINNDDVLLDVGCNNGMMPELISKKAKFVYGIEIEQKHIIAARNLRQKDNIEYICADATTYDYTNCRPIDCVTLSNVLEHIEHRVDFLKKLVAQVSWKDDNNKKLLIRVPMIDREWIVIYKKELNLEYRLDSTHFTEYTYEQFNDELNQSGIKILSHHVRFGEIYAVCKAS